LLQRSGGFFGEVEPSGGKGGLVDSVLRGDVNRVHSGSPTGFGVPTYSGGERVLESQTGRVTNRHILTLICELSSEGVKVSMLCVEGPRSAPNKTTTNVDWREDRDADEHGGLTKLSCEACSSCLVALSRVALSARVVSVQALPRRFRAAVETARVGSVAWDIPGERVFRKSSAAFMLERGVGSAVGRKVDGRCQRM
jgi:hypothetical protein